MGAKIPLTHLVVSQHRLKLAISALVVDAQLEQVIADCDFVINELQDLKLKLRSKLFNTKEK